VLWGLLLWSIGCVIIVPLDWENGSSNVIGPDEGGRCSPERDGVLGHFPVGRVPSLNFPPWHLQMLIDAFRLILDGQRGVGSMLV